MAVYRTMHEEIGHLRRINSEMLECLEQAAAAYEMMIVSKLDFTDDERAAMERDLANFEAAIRKAKGEL